MAVRAYLDPIPEAYPNGANQAAIDAVDARNAQALLFAQQEIEHQIKRFFKKCMPSWLRAKLLEQPDNRAIEDLCLLARKQLTIHNLCKMDDYSDGAFNEVISTITENLVNALSKITQTQEAMENKMNALAKQLDEKNQDKRIATKRQAINQIEDTVAETSGEILEETEDTEDEMAIVIIFIEVEDKTIQTIHSNNDHFHQHQHRHPIKAQNKVQVQNSVVKHLYKSYPQKVLVT